jgi:predicted RecA/RadA family phage recombinase
MAATYATFLQDGKRIDYTPGGAVATGDVVVIGSECFVADYPIAANTLGSLAAEGIFQVAKNATLTISAGDAVYWSASSHELNKTSSDVYFGTAVADAAHADTTVKAKLRALQSAVAGQLGLTDLSDVATVGATTTGNLLICTGSAWDDSKLLPVSLNTASSGAVCPFVMTATCVFTEAGGKAVATTPCKCRVVNVQCISVGTDAANLGLYQGSTTTDLITGTITKSTTTGQVVNTTTLVAAKQEVATATAIALHSSAAATVEVVVWAVPVA